MDTGKVMVWGKWNCELKDCSFFLVFLLLNLRAREFCFRPSSDRGSEAWAVSLSEWPLVRLLYTRLSSKWLQLKEWTHLEFLFRNSFLSEAHLCCFGSAARWTLCLFFVLDLAQWAYFTAILRTQCIWSIPWFPMWLKVYNEPQGPGQDTP